MMPRACPRGFLVYQALVYHDYAQYSTMRVIDDFYFWRADLRSVCAPREIPQPLFGFLKL